MEITRTLVADRDRALLGGDYASYHKQTTRTVQNLRRRLGVATPKGRKYTAKATITAGNVAAKPEYVKLLLASSERSWASAMSMKTAQAQENTQKPIPGSTKRQIVSRLRRAIIFAQNVVGIVEDKDVTKATTTDIVEAKAYLALMKGALEFEKTRWQECLSNYSVSRVIYATLNEGARTDSFKDLLSTTVDPVVRYTAYQLKISRTKPLRDVSIEQFPTSESATREEILEIDSHAFDQQAASETTESKTGVSTVTWRSRTVKVEDAGISQALATANEQEEALAAKAKGYEAGDLDANELATAYEEMINARQEAADATKTAIEEMTAEGVAAGDPRMQSLQVTRTAVNYAVIEWRIGRNRILCGRDDGLTFESEARRQFRKSKQIDQPNGDTPGPREEKRGRKLARLRERVALYDAILQSIDGVKELPGVVADEDFVHQLDQKKEYFRSLKCLNIGRSHGLDGSNVKALALYSRAMELSQAMSASSGAATTSSPTLPVKFDLDSAAQQSLASSLKTLVIQTQALVDLKNMHSQRTAGQSKRKLPFEQPLIHRLHLNRYEEDVDLSNLVNFPPKLQPVPVKPLFFDIAWNYIDYPGKTAQGEKSLANGRAAAVTAEEEETPQATKRGWFGFGR